MHEVSYEFEEVQLSTEAGTKIAIHVSGRVDLAVKSASDWKISEILIDSFVPDWHGIRRLHHVPLAETDPLYPLIKGAIDAQESDRLQRAVMASLDERGLDGDGMRKRSPAYYAP